MAGKTKAGPGIGLASPDPTATDPDVIHAWRQMAEHLNLGLFLHVNGILEFVSDIVLRITGLSREEMVGTPFWNWVHPEDRVLVAERAAARVRGQDVPERYALRALHKDGRTIWLDLRAAKVQYKGRDAIMGYVVDVTDRKAAEEALEEEARRRKKDLEGIRGVLDMAIKLSPLPVIVSALDDGRFIEVNEPLCQMMGLSAEEVVGKTGLELGVWVDPDQRRSIYRELRRSGWVKNVEVMGKTRQGKVVTCLYTAQVAELDGRKVAMAVIVDITPQKEAMARLAESEAQYRELVEGAPVGIGVYEVDSGKVVSVNDRYCEFVGYAAREILGRSPEYMLDEESRRDFLKRRASLLSGETRAYTTENRLLTRDGQVRWAIISVNLVPVEKDRPMLARAIITDITARRRAETELAQRERELLMKSRQLSEMNMSLRKLSRRRSDDFKAFEARILENIQDLVVPYVERLKDSPLNMDQRVFLNIVEANLSEIVAPFMRRIGERHNNLTPREVEVANLVRMGNSSKEIAKLLGITKRAVEFHRDSLRDKMGLKKSKKNLRAYLASIR